MIVGISEIQSMKRPRTNIRSPVCVFECGEFGWPVVFNLQSRVVLRAFRRPVCRASFSMVPYLIRLAPGSKGPWWVSVPVACVPMATVNAWIVWAEPLGQGVFDPGADPPP